MQGYSTIQEDVLEVGMGKAFRGCKTSSRTENQVRRLYYALAHCVAAGLVQIRAWQCVTVVFGPDPEHENLLSGGRTIGRDSVHTYMSK